MKIFANENFSTWLKGVMRKPLLASLVFGLCILTVLGFLQYRNAMAAYVWREWHLPTLALALDHSDAPLAIEIGNFYFGTTVAGGGVLAYDPALAKRAFDKALAMQEGILWGHYQLARIAFMHGDFETALTEINAELAVNPQNLRSLYIRGLIYGYRNTFGDLVLAESDFARFVAWAPTEWAGYNDLTWILAKEGKYGEMERVLERALDTVPQAEQNPWLWNQLGVARFNLGDTRGARDAFEKALEYANQLTAKDWQSAYSGNSPEEAKGGLEAFIASIKKNIASTSP